MLVHSAASKSWSWRLQWQVSRTIVDVTSFCLELMNAFLELNDWSVLWATCIGLLQLLEPNISVNAVTDCRRLGKYISGEDSPRPILARLARRIDVQNLLSKRYSLVGPVKINWPESRRENSWCCPSEPLRHLFVSPSIRFLQSGVSIRSLLSLKPGQNLGSKLSPNFNLMLFLYGSWASCCK